MVTAKSCCPEPCYPTGRLESTGLDYPPPPGPYLGEAGSNGDFAITRGERYVSENSRHVPVPER